MSTRETLIHRNAEMGAESFDPSANMTPTHGKIFLAWNRCSSPSVSTPVPVLAFSTSPASLDMSGRLKNDRLDDASRGRVVASGLGRAATARIGRATAAAAAEATSVRTVVTSRLLPRGHAMERITERDEDAIDMAAI
jgi:hypothetical protein